MSEAGRVVVVGGGVVGAACAYYLAKDGHAVTVVDRGAFGAGCSHANCGYICPSHVLPFAGPGAIRSTLKTLFQRESPLKVRAGVVLRDPRWFLTFARRCNVRDRHTAGMALRSLLTSSRSLFDELICEEQLDCEWEKNGLLFVFQSHAAFEHYAETDRLLRDEFATPARCLDAAALQVLEPALKPGLAGGYHYESDAHLRPDRLMRELRRVLTVRGVEIREQCEVTGFTEENGRATGLRTASGETIPCEKVVIAAGAWTPWLRNSLGCRVPIQPGKGYSITSARPVICPRIPMIFEEHRVAVTPFRSGYRIGSTMEFAGYDASMNRNRLRLLTDGASPYLREPIAEPLEEEWWGWRPMTPDSLPMIGRSPKWGNVWLAAGHNMLGLSLATGTGRLIAEMLSDRTPHVDPTPFAVTRF